ncbi:DUF4880 domain-containing protein [Verticiella sediminum]|uniref:DUF4880 domain-containing protein n=1 Tax=Verticiella sediminum TaxID=1247510 RepID=A0A556ATX8_9BURK|nr:FecR domain-containing protein [Verticiella sediminum]TSH96398.1 DUF4880 domain-containing protein [Verticiella sediminum]
MGVEVDEAAEARELEEYFRAQDPIDVAAAEWHTRREQGLTAAEQAEFEQWMAACPAHAAAFRRLDEGLAALRSLPADAIARVRASSCAAPTAVPARVGQAPRPGAGRSDSGKDARRGFSLNRALSRPALAALCCVAVLAGGLGWYQWQQPQVFADSYSVERGQREVVTLPDGTELAMDADTQAQVVLYRDRREVRIREGQIMFAVAPDSDKPFHVLAGPARVTVVGTRFCVRYRSAGMDAGAVNVAVEEGRVRVAGGHAPADGGPAPAVDLAAGQGLTVSPNGALGQAAAVAPSSIALWRKGLVRFENTPLADALLELERYGPTGLVIRNPAVAAMTIGGSYQIDRPGEFARMLTQILPVRLVQGPDGKTEIAAAS